MIFERCKVKTWPWPIELVDGNSIILICYLQIFKKEKINDLSKSTAELL